MPVLVAAPRPDRSYRRGDSLDLAQPLVWTIESFLTEDECAALVARIEALRPAPAPITTAGGFRMEPDVRNNARAMFDDQSFADALDAKVRPQIPARMFGTMQPAGICVNERFRGYRYDPGQRFAPHFDGAFIRDPKEESLLTFMVYLNEGFGGGATRFDGLGGMEVVPRTGLALFFQHHLLHEGCPVESGVKYVLRSDVMFREVT